MSITMSRDLYECLERSGLEVRDDYSGRFIQSSAEYPPLLSEAKVEGECRLFLLKLLTISKIYVIIDT